MRDRIGWKAFFKKFIVQPFIDGAISSGVGYAVGAALASAIKAAVTSLQDFGNVFRNEFVKAFQGPSTAIFALSILSGGVISVYSNLSADYIRHQMYPFFQATRFIRSEAAVRGISRRAISIINQWKADFLNGSLLSSGFKNFLTLGINAAGGDYRSVLEIGSDILILMAGTFIEAAFNLGENWYTEPYAPFIKDVSSRNWRIGSVTIKGKSFISGIFQGFVAVPFSTLDIAVGG